MRFFTRYIFRGSHIKDRGTRVGYNAFYPHPHDELSVTNKTDLSEEEVWGFGVITRNARREKEPNLNLMGRGDFPEGAIPSELRAEHCPTPENQHHWCLYDWPSEKSKQVDFARRLVAQCECVLPSTGAL